MQTSSGHDKASGHPEYDVGPRASLDIPSAESLLRVVSVQPNIDTEEELKDFITKHILNSLQLTEIQREHLNLKV